MGGRNCQAPTFSKLPNIQGCYFAWMESLYVLLSKPDEKITGGDTTGGPSSPVLKLLYIFLRNEKGTSVLDPEKMSDLNTLAYMNSKGHIGFTREMSGVTFRCPMDLRVRTSSIICKLRYWGCNSYPS